MFAGNLAGRTQTLPLAVFELQQTDPRGAALLSMLLVAVSLAVLLALRGRFLRPA
jgi:molybdate transport system permease protein